MKFTPTCPQLQEIERYLSLADTALPPNSTQSVTGSVQTYKKREWDQMSPSQKGAIFKHHNILLLKDRDLEPTITIPTWNTEPFHGIIDMNAPVQVQGNYLHIMFHTYTI